MMSIVSEAVAEQPSVDINSVLLEDKGEALSLLLRAKIRSVYTEGLPVCASEPIVRQQREIPYWAINNPSQNAIYLSGGLFPTLEYV